MGYSADNTAIQNAYFTADRAADTIEDIIDKIAKAVNDGTLEKGLSLKGIDGTETKKVRIETGAGAVVTEGINSKAATVLQQATEQVAQLKRQKTSTDQILR